MRIDDVKIGEQYTFYPTQREGNNLHFPATIVGLNKKSARIKYQCAGGLKEETVPAKCLVSGQTEIPA